MFYRAAVFAVALLVPAVCRGDDYGDHAAASHAVSPGTNAIGGTIEIDIDRDWFSFAALPSVVYGITVTTGTLWDSVVTLVAPDGKTGLFETSSVGSGAAAQLTWTNNGALGTYYVKIGGFAEFTTGTYSLVVNRLNWTDANTNGILDSWEIQYWTNLIDNANGDDDGDGFTNQQEYYMGSNPRNAGSGLLITDIQRGSNLVKVFWQGAPYGLYRVSANTNFSSSWSNLATNFNASTSTILNHSDVAPPFTGRFYRVEFLY